MGTPDHLDALLVYIESSSNPWLLSRRHQLGLYYLAQHAADAGYRVKVDCISANDHVAERLGRVLREGTCKLVGFYVDQDNLWDIRRVVPCLKRQDPKLRVVLGGPQMTAAPELTLQRIPDAQCGAIGEAEDTFVELLGLPTLACSRLKNCAGLAIRTPSGVQLTPPRAPITPLDRLSIPRREKLTVDDDEPAATMMITGRGCTGRCAFCYEGGARRRGTHLRLHSLERCIEEFDYLAANLDNAYICILDDAFTAAPRRLRAFCSHLIRKYKGRVKWFCEARVDTLARYPDLLPLMVEAGLFRLQVGGESGVQRILDAYGKGTTLEQMISVTEAARHHGLLSLFMNFIIGGAFETRDTYAQTREFVLDLLRRAPGCLSVGGSLFTPYPGTPMFDDPAAFGLQVLDLEGVTHSGDRHAFCRTAELSKFDILAVYHDYTTAVNKCMSTLCGDLPAATLERHFRAFYEYDLSTEWYDVASTDPLVDSYFRALCQGSAQRFEAIRPQQLPEACPVRTTELVTSMGKCYLVRTPFGDVRQLDSLESSLLELSCGKLSFGDILAIVGAQLPGLAPSALREAVLARYERFDREYLVVWRANPAPQRAKSHTLTASTPVPHERR